MKYIRLLLLAVTGLPFHVDAQSAQTPAAAMEASPTPAPLTYQSVFASYQRLVESNTSPDQLWRQANRTVAGPLAHSAHGAAPMVMPAPAAAVETPRLPRVDDPHTGHSMPMKGQ